MPCDNIAAVQVSSKSPLTLGRASAGGKEKRVRTNLALDGRVCPGSWPRKASQCPYSDGSQRLRDTPHDVCVRPKKNLRGQGLPELYERKSTILHTTTNRRNQPKDLTGRSNARVPMKKVKLSWFDSAFVTASGSPRRSTKQRTVSGQSPARPRQRPLRNPPEPSDEVNARKRKRPKRQQRAVLRTDLPIQRMTAPKE